jgi:hypothetical protein
MSKSLKRVLASTVAAVVFTLALSGSAKADRVNGCSITSVALDGDDPSFRLVIGCDGIAYYTNPGGACPTASTAAVRLWESMAMAAMLAGKKVNLYYATLNGCPVRTLQMLEVVK